MKVWIPVYRAGESDRTDGGVEDDFFLVAYRRLDQAQKECRAHLKDIFDQEEMSSLDIQWAETTQKGDKLRKFMGRPVADVEGWFDLYQVEVV